MSPDGVFLDDRKVIDLGQIVERIHKDDVAEVRAHARHVWRHVGRGALIGAIAGGAILALGSASCSGPNCWNAGETVALGATLGGTFGAIFGAVVGVTTQSPEVIYRGP